MRFPRRIVVPVTLMAWGCSVVPAMATPAPTAVTTNRSWSVATQPLGDPLSAPAGPAGTTLGLPPTGCGPTTPGTGPGTGEGLVSITMAAPGTDWASAANTSVAVDVRVDAAPVQQVVLFDGDRPFRYEAFTGGITPGRHCVTLTVDRGLSHTSTIEPRLVVYRLTLGIVPVSSPAFLLESHAPVLYGRSTSAVGDSPLVTYGQQSADPDGVDTDLAYTVIWTHEDVGDGAVAAYEWGLWGRMTDIETVLHEKVKPDGHILSATYLSCGCESYPAYPDIVPEDPSHGGETDKAYPTNRADPALGSHLALRDATGNNDVSPYGTSGYRLQQTLVVAPSPGQAREVAMDQNPWTYRISDDEMARETVSSSDPHDFLAGRYPQYLIVDIDSRPVGTGSVSIEIQLNGGAWFSNDYEQTSEPGPAVPTTFPFYNGGHGRTVIKLPTAWHSSTITGLRLRLNGSAPGVIPTLGSGPKIQLIEVTPGFTVVDRPTPPVAVTTFTQIVPASLGH